MNADSQNSAPLNHTPCVKCGTFVDDRAPACPQCGEKVYVEHPADITPTKHEQLPIHKKS